MAKLFIPTAALLAMLSVVGGAFGAHALRSRLSGQEMHSFETAVQYQFIHAIALLIIGLLLQLHPDNKLLGYSGSVMIAGVLLFSGSLYILVLTNIKHLAFINVGLVTPLGGSLLIVSWAILFFAALKL